MRKNYAVMLLLPPANSKYARLFRLSGLLLLFSLLLLPGTLYAQEETLTIRGRVFDTHEPPAVLPGVSVQVKGTTNGTLTDADGYFTIKAKKNQVLLFSMVSYLPAEFTVLKSNNSLNISLKDNVTALNEVVVMGLTEIQRKHIASSVASLDVSANIKGKPITSLSQSLQGGMTGVQVTQASGLPGGDAAAIKIRGTTSLNNNNPLVLVDGVPGDMNFLDPTTIESVTVLKDAAAASQYGARGANGVIVITTKRGVPGKVAVAYDGYYGVQSAAYLPELVDAATYMNMYNEGQLNAGKPVFYATDDIKKTASGEDPLTYPNTNWLDLMIGKNNPITSHSLSISGGNNVARFALTGNYLHQDGMIPNTNANNYQIRANTSTSLSKTFVVNLDLLLLKRNTQQANRPNDASNSGNRILQDIYRTPPTILPRYPSKDGMPDSYGRYVDIVNPFAVGEIGGKRTFESGESSINLQPKWEVFPNFNLRGQLSFKLNSQVSKTYRDNYNFFDYYTGQLLQTWDVQRIAAAPTRGTYYYVGANADYTIDRSGHHIYMIAGYSQEETNSGSFDIASLLSGYAKVNYSYQDKYLLEASIRADGSSKFGPGHRTGYFPAAALGWNVSKEAFLENSRVIKNLKLRASYGKLGNENIGLYKYQSTINADDGSETIYGNPGITWESVAMLDLGMDLSLFKKFDITFDYYNKTTSNIILSPPLAASSGYTDNVPLNAGEVRNKGFELSLNYRETLCKDLHLFIKPGFTYNTNTIVSLTGGPYISGNTINEVGGSIGSLFGYKTKGLLQPGDFDSKGNPLVPVIKGEQPGDIRYLDRNDDGVISANDQVRIGNPVPRLDYFTNVQVDYKHFNLEILLQGSGQSDVPLVGMLAYPLDIAGGGGTPSTYYAKNYWQPGRIDARFPRISTSPEKNKELSDFWFQNAAYLRVKYIQFGYAFNDKLVRRIGLSSASIYANAQNPFTFTGMKLTDPESRGSEWTYGIQKTYTIGVSVHF